MRPEPFRYHECRIDGCDQTIRASSAWSRSLYSSCASAVHSIVPREEVAPVTSPKVIDEEELSVVEHEDVEPAEAEQLSLDDTPRPTSPAAPKRKGRASVPSWDDIVFGARPSE